MSVIPERWCDEPDDLPPDDERADERRAIARERSAPRGRGAGPATAAEQKWMDSLPPWDS